MEPLLVAIEKDALTSCMTSFYDRPPLCCSPTPTDGARVPSSSSEHCSGCSHAITASAADQGPPPSAPHALDLRIETTTFLFNLGKQGLQDNTFTNGIGRDTTLIGNLLNVYVRKQLLSSVDLDLGVFLNMPFGHDTEVSQVRPIVRLQYSPTRK